MKALFSAGIALLGSLKEQLLEAQDFCMINFSLKIIETAFVLVDQAPKTDISVEQLLLLMKQKQFRIKNRWIRQLRDAKRGEVEKDLQELIEKKD